MAHPGARHDLVRCGIALYGEPPSAWAAASAAAAGAAPLRPVLSWRARVAYVRRLPAGARPSYGRRRALPGDAVVATVPVGYADGIPRRYFENGGTVLVGGRPCPLAGVVTMDQIVVDCGPGAEVSVGDEVVLIGRQADVQCSATDWAQTLGTISYEVLCGIGPRIPRLLVDTDEEGRT
jgi:alanine racemase